MRTVSFITGSLALSAHIVRRPGASAVLLVTFALCASGLGQSQITVDITRLIHLIGQRLEAALV